MTHSPTKTSRRPSASALFPVTTITPLSRPALIAVADTDRGERAISSSRRLAAHRHPTQPALLRRAPRQAGAGRGSARASVARLEGPVPAIMLPLTGLRWRATQWIADEAG